MKIAVIADANKLKEIKAKSQKSFQNLLDEMEAGLVEKIRNKVSYTVDR